MSDTLRELLLDIRDGHADAEALATARTLLASDERLPAELRAEPLLAEEPAAEAAGLLGLLGEPLEGLAEAVAFEAGDFDVSASVLCAIGVELPELGAAVAHEAGRAELASAITHRVGGVVEPVAEAVSAEAGRVELAAAVAHSLGEDILPIASAVHQAAGRVEISASVAHAIGEPTWPIAEAVRAEAGEIALTDAVMDAILGRQGAPAPAPLPQPANTNTGWGWSGLVLAAAALFAVLVGNIPWSPTAPVPDLVFASAGEIQIDALEYGEQTMVHVVQGEAEHAPLIIWVDEEAVL